MANRRAAAGVIARAVVAVVAAGCGSSSHASGDGGAGPVPPADAAPDAATVPTDAPAMADLQLLAPEMAASIRIGTKTIDASSCDFIEGCVGAPGTRRLLMFDTWAANVGAGDLVLGAPPDAGQSNAVFTWSACRMKHYVASFASFELLDSTTSVVTGRKQACCVQDVHPIAGGAPSHNYSCNFQGLTHGWIDSYTEGAPCQWLDVTDVPSGVYTLRITIDPMKSLPESSYDNNVFSISVTIP